jgi:cytochrome oxidase Cu insertion factor (SCO1/SenC/PrrC family)
MPKSALGYSISHPTDILLLDREGRIVESVPHNVESSYLLARIRDLLNASD